VDRDDRPHPDRARDRARGPRRARQAPREGERPRDEHLGAPDLLTAKPLPDVGGPGLRVLFCGINPSLLSAERGHHFARPGNRFWPALHRSGFTPRQLAPDEDGLLPQLGLGITNLVARPTRAAAELSDDELRAGAAELDALVRAWRPAVVAVVGIGAWRVGFGRPRAQLGLQPELVGGAPVWVLPNTSGLNAHHQLPDLARRFGELREWAAGAVERQLDPPFGPRT
jgi:TDG/mug DNA glycosylase family protein